MANVVSTDERVAIATSACTHEKPQHSTALCIEPVTSTVVGDAIVLALRSDESGT